MQITFSPQRRDDTLVILKQGDVLTINNTVYDFSVIPDGATLPASAINCAFMAGDVERVSGELIIPLILPHGPNPSEAVAFPQPIVNVADGVVELPK